MNHLSVPVYYIQYEIVLLAVLALLTYPLIR